MLSEEAAKIIEQIVESLRNNHGQFNIHVKVELAGAIGIGGPHGAGIVGISQGGGIGVQASASAPTAAQINIAQQYGIQKCSEELSQMLFLLEQLKLELLSRHPSKSKMENILDSLRGKWLPEVVTRVVAELIKSVFSSE